MMKVVYLTILELFHLLQFLFCLMEKESSIFWGWGLFLLPQSTFILNCGLQRREKYFSKMMGSPWKEGIVIFEVDKTHFKTDFPDC